MHSHLAAKPVSELLRRKAGLKSRIAAAGAITNVRRRQELLGKLRKEAEQLDEAIAEAAHCPELAR